MTLPGGGAAPQAGTAVPGPAAIARANLRWARALVEGLVAGGTRHLCLSPGSRSSPLALAAHLDPRLALSVEIDERSAAFLALGIARATRAPVALVCTSGTAAANYLPAVAEAFLSGVPLVLLTADRPPELRGTGAAQTIDQLNLYGSHVRLFRDLPCADEPASTPALAAAAAREACAAATAGAAGPVHLNVPFREPLVPEPDDLPACDADWSRARAALGPLPPAGTGAARAAPGLPVLAALGARLEKARRPLLIAGPGAASAGEAAAVLELARAAGMPVLADIASGLRGAAVPAGGCVCALADLFLRDEAMAALAPDFVLRLGGIPTSKTLATWLARHRPPVVAVQADERRRDPDGIVGEVVVAAAGALCARLATQVTRGRRDAQWEPVFRRAESGARALLAQVPREAAAVAAACAALPPGAALFLSSSMPIRWAELAAPSLAEGVEVFANRGANGIDGIVSSAVGVARGGGRPTLLVTGDLAFLHDAGGLRAARGLRTPLAILLLENGGGGIFSHLPVGRHAPALFEPLFGTPHGCDLAAVSRSCGIEHRVASTTAQVAALAAQTLSGGGVRVIEWRSDRGETAREQARLARLAGMQDERVVAGGLSWQVRGRGPRAGEPLVLLHGFTGTGEFWLPVANALPRRRCLFPDLPGHGGTDAPPPAWRLDDAADALAELLEALGARRFALAGYSMGARLALAFALRHPGRVSALALVGGTPGIADGEARARRAADDLELAEAIERDGIEAFCREWEARPLFATQAGLAPALREAMRRQRRAQDPARLAAALRAFSTGRQAPAHGELGRLDMPVLLLAGELDAKFAGIAEEMARRIGGARARIVAGAGHAVPLERAQACAAEFEEFLNGSIDA